MQNGQQLSNFTILEILNHQSDIKTRGLISDKVSMICQWIIYTVLCNMIDCFGVGTNIINIICFIKQGFKDPVNISLLGLAISDIGCLATLIWTNICLSPAIMSADLPFDSVEFQYLTGGMLHATFSRVTAWITGFITLERCLCITMPLKIKSIFTAKRVTIIIISIFTILMFSASPAYAVNRIGMKYFPARNKTLLGLVYTTNQAEVEKFSYAINNTFIPFTAFVVITVCTLTLAINLNVKAKWRQMNTSSCQADHVSSRNQKVAKMVVTISTLFIICFIPVSINFMAMSLVPGLAIGGRYINMLTLTIGLSLILESINSSINIFVYYHMSSKYKAVFKSFFCSNKVKK